MTQKEMDELCDEIMLLSDREVRIALLAVADGRDLKTSLRMAEEYYDRIMGEEKGGMAYGEDKKMEG